MGRRHPQRRPLGSGEHPLLSSALVLSQSLTSLDDDQSTKRRKITYEIPDEEFASSATRAPEIVELVDIRREYTIALSRLQLSAEFPELERTSTCSFIASAELS